MFARRALPACLMALALLSGCITVHVAPQGAEPLLAGLGLEPGDRVVARWQDSFFEATVVTVQDKLVTVAWDVPPPERSHLPRGWVERIAPPAADAQGWQLCRRSETWVPCQIEASGPQAVKVKLAGLAESLSLDPEELCPVPAGLRGWVARRAEAEQAAATLAAQIDPQAPLSAGQAVQPDQRVLGRWIDGGWYEARVAGQGDGSVTLVWSDGSAPSPVPVGDVAPIPDAPEALQPGAVAFCRWSAAARWWPARVEEASSTVLRVTYRDGEEGRVAPGECVGARP